MNPLAEAMITIAEQNAAELQLAELARESLLEIPPRMRTHDAQRGIANCEATIRECGRIERTFARSPGWPVAMQRCPDCGTHMVPQVGEA